MRNRQYDPATGRFTQEDPIGLAGGLNAYGFANGDPVNFSDPFGLCRYSTDRAACGGATDPGDAKVFVNAVAKSTNQTPEQVQSALSSEGGLTLPVGQRIDIQGHTWVPNKGNVLRLSSDGGSIEGKNFGVVTVENGEETVHNFSKISINFNGPGENTTASLEVKKLGVTLATVRMSFSIGLDNLLSCTISGAKSGSCMP